MPSPARARTVAAGLLAAVALAGCSGEVSIGGPGSVSTEDLEEQVSTQLTETVGQAPDDVTCPDELPAEEGEEVRCELTADGTTYGVTVTTTSVEGETVNFDIQVDDEPTG